MIWIEYFILSFSLNLMGDPNYGNSIVNNIKKWYGTPPKSVTDIGH